MKTYVITLAKCFPVTHKRAGEETHFKEKFLLGQGCPDCATPQDLSGINISDCNGCVRACSYPKLHTIRANYPLWVKRMKEVQEGKACLSVRQWTGKPYRSKQVEITTLTAEDGIGIQSLVFPNRSGALIGYEFGKLSLPINFSRLSDNDGLSLADWCDWFRKYDLSKPMAIIHFTKFRY